MQTGQLSRKHPTTANECCSWSIPDPSAYSLAPLTLSSGCQKLYLGCPKPDASATILARRADVFVWDRCLVSLTFASRSILYLTLNRRDSIASFKNPASGVLRFASSKPFKQGGGWSTRKDRDPGLPSLQVVWIVPVLSFKKKLINVHVNGRICLKTCILLARL